MNPKQDVVEIKLEEPQLQKAKATNKLALRIKANHQEIFIYNGASQYLVQTVLKEWNAHVS